MGITDVAQIRAHKTKFETTSTPCFYHNPHRLRQELSGRTVEQDPQPEDFMRRIIKIFNISIEVT